MRLRIRNKDTLASLVETDDANSTTLWGEQKKQHPTNCPTTLLLSCELLQPRRIFNALGHDEAAHAPSCLERQRVLRFSPSAEDGFVGCGKVSGDTHNGQTTTISNLTPFMCILASVFWSALYLYTHMSTSELFQHLPVTLVEPCQRFAPQKDPHSKLSKKSTSPWLGPSTSGFSSNPG